MVNSISQNIWKEYNNAFLRTVWNCSRFRRFLADSTQFDGSEPQADISATHRWEKRGKGRWSTADMLVVLYSSDSEARLALHIEHKWAGGDWEHRAPKSFQLRPLRATASRTVLVAPNRALEARSKKAAAYDVLLTYEDVADFVPEFSDEIDESNFSFAKMVPDFPKGGLI